MEREQFPDSSQIARAFKEKYAGSISDFCVFLMRFLLPFAEKDGVSDYSNSPWSVLAQVEIDAF
ncbi:hypothetical protein [Anaerotruncus colihominis]|uniref:hypothetical protein n=1 Tax=Anaerotruncus colihominis TaxID=169435 RepID=UPI00111FC9A1|nr:hypothetical protein [Anaerotruncus colihominis]